MSFLPGLNILFRVKLNEVPYLRFFSAAEVNVALMCACLLPLKSLIDRYKYVSIKKLAQTWFKSRRSCRKIKSADPTKTGMKFPSKTSQLGHALALRAPTHHCKPETKYLTKLIDSPHSVDPQPLPTGFKLRNKTENNRWLL